MPKSCALTTYYDGHYSNKIGI